MDSLILSIASRFIIPLQLALALFLLLRGHNEPGGGFIAGLVAATALVLYAYAHGTEATRRRLRLPPETWMASGLLLALLGGLGGVLVGQPYLTGLWDGSVPLPAVGKVKLGTPLLFDIGVFLLVFGVTIQIFLSLLERPRTVSPPESKRRS
jgi:multicomponent Na+:H+ antiporter subunit B